MKGRLPATNDLNNGSLPLTPNAALCALMDEASSSYRADRSGRPASHCKAYHMLGLSPLSFQQALFGSPALSGLIATFTKRPGNSSAFDSSALNGLGELLVTPRDLEVRQVRARVSCVECCRELLSGTFSKLPAVFVAATKRPLSCHCQAIELTRQSEKDRSLRPSLEFLRSTRHAVASLASSCDRMRVPASFGGATVNPAPVNSTLSNMVDGALHGGTCSLRQNSGALRCTAATSKQY